MPANTIIHHIEKRLQEWASWFNRMEDGGFGYPTCSIEARLAETGGVLVKGFWPKQVPTHPSAEEIERLVCELFKQSAKPASALREYYLKRGTVKAKAARLGISSSQFTIELELARYWLAGRITMHNYE